MTESSRIIGGLRTIVVESPRPAALTVVLLHGYAMTPESLSPFASSLGVPARFYLPEGSVAAQPTGSAWWPKVGAEADSTSPRDLASACPEGRDPARAALRRFLDEVRSERDGPLALIGFSQGGMLACEYVLHGDGRVAALGLLSASRICLREWQEHRNALAGLRVFVAHGESDSDLAYSAGMALRDFCGAAGAEVTWFSFSGGHEIPLPVWRALKTFLRGVAVAPNS